MQDEHRLAERALGVVLDVVRAERGGERRHHVVQLERQRGLRVLGPAGPVAGPRAVLRIRALGDAVEVEVDARRARRRRGPGREQRDLSARRQLGDEQRPQRARDGPDRLLAHARSSAEEPEAGERREWQGRHGVGDPRGGSGRLRRSGHDDVESPDLDAACAPGRSRRRGRIAGHRTAPRGPRAERAVGLRRPAELGPWDPSHPLCVLVRSTGRRRRRCEERALDRQVRVGRGPPEAGAVRRRAAPLRTSGLAPARVAGVGVPFRNGRARVRLARRLEGGHDAPGVTAGGPRRGRCRTLARRAPGTRRLDHGGARWGGWGARGRRARRIVRRGRDGWAGRGAGNGRAASARRRSATRLRRRRTRRSGPWRGPRVGGGALGGRSVAGRLRAPAGWDGARV